MTTQFWSLLYSNIHMCTNDAQSNYRVSLVVWQLGWVDLDLDNSPGWLAAIVATYCQSRMVEHLKSE